MRVEQFQDIIDIAAHLHRVIGEYFSKHTKDAGSDRDRLLLDYLAHHEEQLAIALERYESEARPGLMRTWFQNEPVEAMLRDIEMMIESQNLKERSQIAHLALDLCDTLIEFYKHLAEHAEIQSLREAIESLIELELRDKLKLARNAQQLRDI